MGENSIKIVVAAHKAYAMPADPMYLPLHVGAALGKPLTGEGVDPRFVGDDSGENISALNKSFCELTGLYFEWKNLKEEYLGLAHYRRHFAAPSRKGRTPMDVHYRRHFAAPSRKGRTPMDAIREEEIRPMLGHCLVFVPKKRCYVIETLYTHYAHTHYAGHLDETREIIRSTCPIYLPHFDHVMQQRSGYMFNMMIMHRSCLDRYCAWLFPILFELRDRLKAKDSGEGSLSTYQGRLYGRVSELLLNVWLRCEVESGHLDRDKVCELPYFSTEKTNWIKKGGAFLRAKVLHKKYEGSF